MYSQCDILEVIKPFNFKPAKGRHVVGKVGQLFWVTTPTYKNSTSCKIDRKGKGKINIGWLVDNKDIERFFKKVS